jgi:DNA-binding LytR/AlgR family response regulator
MLKPFFVWQDKLLKRIDPEKVAFLYADKNYVHFVLEDKTSYMVRTSLSRAVKKLPQDMFVKILRDLVVSIYYVDNIARDHLIVGGESSGIGKQYYQSFIRKLNIID